MKVEEVRVTFSFFFFSLLTSTAGCNAGKGRTGKPYGSPECSSLIAVIIALTTARAGRKHTHGLVSKGNGKTASCKVEVLHLMLNLILDMIRN